MVSVQPTLINIVRRPFQWVANNSLMKKCCDNFKEDPTKMLEYTTIASLVGKDTIGCALYVMQSLNNEKIPEEKRSFVASLDLTNGLLMILSQLAAFFTLSRPAVQKKLFGKFFDHVFEKNFVKNMITSARNKAQDCGLAGSFSKEEAMKQVESVKKTAQDMFRVISSLIASTTIAKRILVPFIATPMAGWAQEKIIDKKKPAKESKNPADNIVEQTNKNDKFISENSIKVDTTTIDKDTQKFKGNLLNKYMN